MREHYSEAGLHEPDVDPDPMVQFERWFAEWTATEPYDASAMIVSTVDADGWPAARAVLLKGLDERGFAFYTNRLSAKGRELELSPRASASFLWHPIERQVRVVGDVGHLPDDESDAYFASRPRASQIGAWASEQSAVIADRGVLEAAAVAADAAYPDEVPRPPHWGGYVIRPRSFEFWQGRRDRLHDRIRYTRRDGGWTIDRLAP